MTTKFETKTCTRCGGNGRYSFNLMHGDRCYGCNGTGKQHTKRGLVARSYFFDITTALAGDVRVGWLILDDLPGKKPVWLPVLETRDDTLNAGYVTMSTRRSSYGCHRDVKTRAVPSEQALHDAMAEALAYQGTLTVTGKPSKRPKITAVIVEHHAG
jgi:hypothetical protein